MHILPHKIHKNSHVIVKWVVKIKLKYRGRLLIVKKKRLVNSEWKIQSDQKPFKFSGQLHFMSPYINSILFLCPMVNATDDSFVKSLTYSPVYGRQLGARLVYDEFSITRLFHAIASTKWYVTFSRTSGKSH